MVILAMKNRLDQIIIVIVCKNKKTLNKLLEANKMMHKKQIDYKAMITGYTMGLLTISAVVGIYANTWVNKLNDGMHFMVTSSAEVFAEHERALVAIDEWIYQAEMVKELIENNCGLYAPEPMRKPK